MPKTSLLSALFGNRPSVRDSGRRYLAMQMAIYGVDVSQIPVELLQELTDRAVQRARASAVTQNGHRLAQVSEMLEVDAVNISYLLDDKDAAGWQMVEKTYAQSTIPLLRKYGIRVRGDHGTPGPQIP